MDNEKLEYYAGFNDGLGACNSVLTELLITAKDCKDITVLKLLISKSVETVISIMEETSIRLSDLIDEEKEKINGLG